MGKTVLVLGSGPIRIGQGIEFDYACVHCVWMLQEMGYKAIIINNNPETVSTDFDTGDALFFEPVTLSDVMQVIRHTEPIGVVLQFGGQTAINLAAKLQDAGVTILGTSPDAIATAEDRDQFDRLLRDLHIAKPAGRAVKSLDEAVEVASKIDYPVLIRPSFVLGGRAMEIAYTEEALRSYYAEAEAANPGQPVLIDQYLNGQEAEVDAISDGHDVLLPGIMEHIERAGVHSGDSMAVFPPVSLSADTQSQIVRAAIKIARALNVRGLMNIQFAIKDNIAYVIEVNPRGSRTIPYLSKVTSIPMVQLATRCMMGERLADMGYSTGLWDAPKREVLPERNFESEAPTLPERPFYAVKAPVFSFQKLTRVEPSLGPEMKSTGEILGIDFEYEAALYKALLASGIQFRGSGKVIFTLNDRDKALGAEIALQLVQYGYEIAATSGTFEAFERMNVPAMRINKVQEGSPNILDMVQAGEVSLMVNTPGLADSMTKEAAVIRRACIESGIACITTIDTASALARSIAKFRQPDSVSCLPYWEYLS